MRLHKKLLQSTILAGVSVLAVGAMVQEASAQIVVSASGPTSVYSNSAPGGVVVNSGLALTNDGTFSTGAPSGAPNEALMYLNDGSSANNALQIGANSTLTLSGGTNSTINVENAGASIMLNTGAIVGKEGNALGNAIYSGENVTINNGGTIQASSGTGTIVVENDDLTYTGTGAVNNTSADGGGNDDAIRHIGTGAVSITVNGGVISSVTGAAINIAGSSASGQIVELSNGAAASGGILLGGGVGTAALNLTGTGNSNLTGVITGLSGPATITTMTVNKNTGTTVSVSGAVTEIDSLVVTSGELDMNANSSVGAVSVAANGILDIAGMTSFTVTKTGSTDDDFVVAGQLQTSNTTIINGNLTLAAGSTVTGDTVFDGGASVLTFNGNDVDNTDTYTVAFDGGAGADELLVLRDAGDTVILTGAVSGFETVNVTSGNLTLSGAVTGTTNFNVTGGQTLTFNTANSGVNFTTIDLQAAGATVVFDRAGQTFAGNITDSNAGTEVQTVTLTNGIFDGNISLAAGNDILNLNGGTLGVGADTVDMGDGDDVITVAGATVASAISGGAGADTFQLNSGTIDGAIDAGAGANIINVAGATVNGVISGGADVDTITISSGSVTAAVNAGDGADVITVSGGTVANTASLNGGAGADTFQLTGGTIDGAIDAGAGANIINVAGATVNGIITGGADVDTITISSGSVTAAVNAGDGADSITVSGGTVANTASLNGGAGANTFNLSGGTIAGAVNGGADVDTINLSGGTVSGLINVAAGNDIINYSGGTFTTGFDMGANGTDTFNVTANNLSTGATIDGADVFSIATGNTFTVNHAVNSNTNGHGDLDLAAGAKLIANLANVRVGGNVDFVGASTLAIKTGRTVTAANIANGANGTLEIEFDNTTSGQLILTGIADMSAVTLFPVHALGTDFAGSKSYVVVNGAAGNATGFKSITDINSLFAFSQTEDDVNGDIVLHVAREGSLNQLASTPNGGAVSVELQKVLELNTLNPTDPVVQALATRLTLSNDQQIAAIIESVSPTVDMGGAFAGLIISQQSNASVGTRLASLRDAHGAETGMVAGNALQGVEVWGQIFGTSSDQALRDGIAGYDAHSVGTAFGADTSGLLDNATIGLAFSYGDTDVGSKNINGTRTNIDSYQVTAYGSYDFNPNLYLNGYLSYAYNDMETRRDNVGILGNTAHGDYSSNQYGARFELGHDFHDAFQRRGVTLTPEVFAQYTFVDTDTYTEKGASGLGLKDVSTDDLQALDLGLNLMASYDHTTATGGVLTPSIRVGYSYEALDEQLETSASFIAGGGTFVAEGFDPAQHSVSSGVGLEYASPDSWNLSASYGYTYKSDYDAHTGIVKASYKF